MPTKFLKFKQLKDLDVPHGRDRIRAMIKAGEFPAPVTFSPRVNRWVADEITAWAEGRIARRDAERAADPDRSEGASSRGPAAA